ncbi:hypothetical protein BGP_0868 [Beggiatoa sp. PS]|nr:hypothetical protein BGP_0868 [Beggiatoa sp. PS]
MVGKRAARMLINIKNRTACLPTLHQMEITPVLKVIKFSFLKGIPKNIIIPKCLKSLCREPVAIFGCPLLY